jgi:DNA-directed RNA polymerase subunit L
MMANAPDRFLTWRWEEEPNENDNDMEISTNLVAPPPKRLQYTKDSKRPNAGTFILAKEDHTIGNLMRLQLLRDPNVRYAGYRMPHPLIFDCHIRVETMDAKLTPIQVFFSFLKLSPRLRIIH